MPMLTKEPLERLLGEARRSDAAAILPRTPDGRLQPLCAAYARRALGPLESELKAGTRKITQALQSVAWTALDVEDTRPFLNLNRKGELSGLD